MTQSSIDWEQVRYRLKVSETALGEAFTESPSRRAAVYSARAELLAKPQGTAKSEAVPSLVFSLAGERYAIELRQLAEVMPFAGCIPVPGSLPTFRGVVSERGELRPVADLGRLIAPEESSGDAGFVLLLRRPGREIGLRVDRIEALGEFREEDFSAPPQARYVRAIAPGGLMLLDLDRVLEELYSTEDSSTG